MYHVFYSYEGMGMMNFKSHDTSMMQKDLGQAIHFLCEQSVPDNIFVQKYEDDEQGYWIASSLHGEAVLPVARKIQVLDELNVINEVQSLDMYEQWLYEVSDEIERNWKESNTIYVSTFEEFY